VDFLAADLAGRVRMRFLSDAGSKHRWKQHVPRLAVQYACSRGPTSTVAAVVLSGSTNAMQTWACPSTRTAESCAHSTRARHRSFRAQS